MKKLILIILILSTINAKTFRDSILTNWNGYLDTTSISSALATGTIRYGSAFPLTDGENIRLICMVDDTAETGFADDSILFEWGIVVGNVVLNANNALDTSWKVVNPIVIDTMDVDSFGNVRYSYFGTDGSYTTRTKLIDTTTVTGFAVEDVLISPEWSGLFKPFAKGLGGKQRLGKALKFRFAIIRRQYQQVRLK